MGDGRSHSCPPTKPVLTHGWLDPHTKILHTDDLAQDCSHSSALAMELLKFCDEPSIQSELNLKKKKKITEYYLTMMYIKFLAVVNSGPSGLTSPSSMCNSYRFIATKREGSGKVRVGEGGSRPVASPLLTHWRWHSPEMLELPFLFLPFLALYLFCKVLFMYVW